MKKFDLNVEKVLEDWETGHAVREIIANALDEQLLTKTRDVEIYQDKKRSWHIRDFGRGLKYDHLTQKENDEKLCHPNLIGKFGVGLKDALATFDRHHIKVLIKSKFCDISLDKSEKHDFKDIVTLHACISEPSEPDIVGTDCILQGCKVSEIDKAKSLFLKFSGETILEKTQFGEVLSKNSVLSKIYINGVRVAEEGNFLFSYNITSLTTTIRKALNRERTNVGRSAYTDRIKSILLSCKNQVVANALMNDLRNFERGTIQDELQWTDVSIHAVKILSASKKTVYLTPSDLTKAPKFIDYAKDSGQEVIVIPESLKSKISGLTDLSGNIVQDLNEFANSWNRSHEFQFLNPKDLNNSELAIYKKTSRILNLIGGQPQNVKGIKISEKMKIETSTFNEAEGIWNNPIIIIRRSALQSLHHYAGVLLHEIAHAISGADDITREFENELTVLLGKTCSNIVHKLSNVGKFRKTKKLSSSRHIALRKIKHRRR